MAFATRFLPTPLGTVKDEGSTEPKAFPVDFDPAPRCTGVVLPGAIRSMLGNLPTKSPAVGKPISRDFTIPFVLGCATPLQGLIGGGDMPELVRNDWRKG
jgi:hypothetical protein